MKNQLEDTLLKAKRQADVATKALQQSNDTLSRFAGMVAHDLKAPIRNMKNLSEFIFEDYIFEMMSRLHGQEYQGAGIRLATCKWIVHNHQGTIGIESNERYGCNFYFILPSKSDRL